MCVQRGLVPLAPLNPSEMMCVCVLLRRSWCDIAVLNAHVQNEDKNDYSKDSLYEKLEQVFDKFLQHHIIILLCFQKWYVCQQKLVTVESNYLTGSVQQNLV